MIIRLLAVHLDSHSRGPLPHRPPTLFHFVLLAMMVATLATTLPAQTTVTTTGGTTNAVPKFTGASTIGNSVITETGGNVGIGTLSPAATLDVNGAIHSRVSNGIEFSKFNNWFTISDATGYSHLNWFSYYDGTNWKASHAAVKPSQIYANTNGIYFDTSQTLGVGTTINDFTTRLFIANSGNVGMGTTSPDGKLNITGAANTWTANGWSKGLRLDGSHAIELGGGAATKYGIGQSENKLLFFDTIADDNSAAANYRMAISNGNVGIGTISPAYKLDVNGFLRTTSGIVFPNGTIQTTAGAGGTITGVLPGGGLIGGGYSGNVTLSVDGTVARNNASNTFTASQTFSSPLYVNGTAVLIENLQSNKYGVKSTVLSGIAGGFWNKSWHDTSWSSGSIIAGWAGSNMTQMFHVDTRGTTYTYNGYVAGGFDYAELVQVSNIGDIRYEPGDVLVIDKAGISRFALSSEPYSRLVAGVYSTNPGVLGSPHPMEAKLQDSEVPLALLGQVPCKVSAENGPIDIGDLLVTSSTPGHAMRANDDVKPGTIPGKALEPLPYGTGKINILLTLQ